MDTEPFTLVEESRKPFHLFDSVVHFNSAKRADQDLQYIEALRKAFPDLIVTACPEGNAPLRYFAAAGFADCELDKETDSFASWRGYVPPKRRSDSGSMGESISFAKFHYKWNSQDFILYVVGGVQYILKEIEGNESQLGPSKATDELIRTVGNWVNNIAEVVWVYDNYWTQSRVLWEEVQKASWSDVILDENVKDELVSVAHKFFDSKDTYKELGVPWKRGLLFHGPPGNGKTISIRALMHSLYNRKTPIPTLYVRYAPYTYDIREVFELARAQAPCMLILEDVETIVTPDTRSYFFNEMDGLENNDGLFIVASTNFLDKLDPGLSKRPSRFDRKYLFPIPNEHERVLYCEYWRQKLKSNKSVNFPEKLVQPMAHITPGFSFAFLKECFVATLLALARENDDLASDARPFDSDNDDLEDYALWVAFKEQADILRRELENQQERQAKALEWLDVPTHSGPSADACPRPSAHVCRCGGESKNAGAMASGSRMPLRPKRRGELLPELPWYQQKDLWVNPAALEWI